MPVSGDEQRLRLALRDDRCRESDDRFLAVLDETLATLDTAGVEHLLIGGIASTCLGRERWTHDIDVFTRPAEAGRALTALGVAGFDTEETYPEWLFQARKDGELVDVIFRTAGSITVDDEMFRRSLTVTFMGRQVRTVAAEDLVVIKAIVAAEHTPRHWHDALAVIASSKLDWEYLMRRARHGIRRVLSLLLYAQSVDLPVPSRVVRELYFRLEEG